MPNVSSSTGPMSSSGSGARERWWTTVARRTIPLVRRAVLLTLLCAAPLLAASAQASTTLERSALRELLRQDARAASDGVIRLPLPDRAPAAWSAARAIGAERVLVGVRSHAHVDAIAAELRALGARPERFTTIGVLAARLPAGAAAKLAADPRVAYVERDATLNTATDPFDVPDRTEPSERKFTWAYDAVRAGQAVAAVGGGSGRTVAVIDTGLDVSHAEFAGQVARTFDTASGGGDVTDVVGHGTFVSGLISALPDNGLGGKGVAGSTKLVAVRASLDGSFTVSDLIRGIEFSIRRGADVINMSLAGQGFTRSQARALEAAFLNDVLPVAASGNNAQNGNPVEFPAAAIGGRRGGRGIGLSVAATKPDGGVAPFSNHNDWVSLAAPGASQTDCRFGVFSTLPPTTTPAWNEGGCPLEFADAGGRYAYGEGTSFAAPIVSGLAALAWQAESALASEQVAEVMVRSANGGGWNEFTGAGVVDGVRAVEIARIYDVLAPRARGSARRRGNRVRVRVARSADRTQPGDELAGAVTHGLLVSRNGGATFNTAARSRRALRRTVALRGNRANVFVAVACDGNGNCGVRRLGRFKRRR